MKKVFIRESSLEDIKNSELLPPFLFKMVKYHKTSLGDNEAFPKVGEYPFDYSILKKRFGIVSFSLKSLARLDSELDGLDDESLLNYLGSLVRKCKEYEKPIKDTLENIAENALNRLFAIPDGTINITAELTDKITFKHSPRITPESDEGLKYTFKDIADIEFSNKAVEKRRFINSLIQGGSRRMLDTALISEDIIFNDLNKINPELVPLYKKIMIINDYLLFTKKEELDDKNPMQGAYVETHIGADGERSTIEAQGIIFPLLLQELIKGLFEVFSTHGLPSDKKKAMYVIKKADFLLAEPWDMRFGVGLWDAIFGDIHESNVIPYVFTKLIELPTDEFNSSVREILASTEAGNNILDDLVNAAQYDSDYQEFKNKINKKNIDKSVIADSYFSAAELTGLELDDDNDNVIEEGDGDGDGIDYIKLIKSATIDNIDFNEGKITTNGGEQLILTIDGTEIPSEYVDLVVFFMGNELNGKHFKSLNLHIILAEEIQGLGLGTKIYTKMVYEFGSLYSWGETRNNDEHIGKIYQKLSNDPKIEVTTIPNENGKVDYLAVLKGYNIFEGKDKNGELITEGWGQDKKRIIDRCVRLIMDANPAMTTSGAYKLEKKIMDVYFHEYGMGSSLKIRKFEPMVVKILVEELGYPSCPVTSKEQNFLKNIVKCIWNFEVKQGKTPMAVGSFDKNGPDNFETLVAKYKPFIEEVEKSGMNLNGKAKGDNEYTIIPIPDFDTANKWGNWSFPGNANEYGKLCYTTGRDTWDGWIDDGENSCFLCLNEKTYKNWPIDTYPQDNENTPYDDYGLSMVWVFVDQNGNLIHSNTRWNHHRQERIPEMPYGGIGVDESFSKEALEDLLGKPFDAAFNIEGGFKKLTDEVNETLEAINREGDCFNVARLFTTDNGWDSLVADKDYEIVWVNKNKKVNLLKKVNEKWEIAFPNIWLDSFNNYSAESRQLGVLGDVRVGGLYNLIDLDCNFILPNNLWVNDIGGYETFICGKKVKGFLLGKNGLKNIFVPGKGLVFDKFVYELRGANLKTTYTINKDGSITVYPPDGGSPVSLNKIVETYLKTGELHLPVEMEGHFGVKDNIVYFYEYRNIINQNTGKIFNYWFKNLRKDSDITLVSFNDYHVNALKENGELLIDKSPLEWPYHISKYFEKYYIIDGQGGGIENICDLNGNFLFDINDESSWVTDIRIENSNLPGRKLFIHLADYDVDKHNLADENLNLLWKQPKRKWFDSVKFKGGLKTGLFPVKIGEKWNYFSIFENDFLYKQPEENWFDFTRTFLPNALLAVVRFGEGYFNFIDVNGNLLFENSYINDVIPYDEQGVVIVENDGGQENIVDLELGNIVSDEWFDSVKENRAKIRYFICRKDDETFYYDSANGRFTENKGKYSSHDFSDYTHNLKEYLERYRFEIKDELIPNKLYTVVDNEYVEGEKMNIVGVVNGMVQYLLPEWCEFICGLIGHGVCCKIKDNYENLFDISKLQYVFPEPMRDITYYHVGGCFVVYTADGYHCNFVDENCNVMLKNSPRDVYEIGTDENRNEYFIVRYDDGKNIFCPNKNGFLMKRKYDMLDVIRLDFIIIGIRNNSKRLYNLLGKNGEPAFEIWANDITTTTECNQALVKYAKEDGTFSINIFNLDNGEFISDEFLERFERNEHVFFKVVKNGKINYLRNCYRPSEITPIWADNVINEFEDGKHALVMANGKEYTLRTNDRTGEIDIAEGDVYGLGSRGVIIKNENALRSAIKHARTFQGYNAWPRMNGMAKLKHEVVIDSMDCAINMIAYLESGGNIQWFYASGIGIRSREGEKVENEIINLSDENLIKNIIDAID